jgi:hypothetical protein
MANIFTEQKIIDSNKRALVKYVGTVDTAVANTILLDASSLRFSLNANGQIMTSNTNIKSNYRTTIKRIFGYAKANAYYRLQWAGDSNSSIVTIGTGTFDYSFDPMGDGAVISNPEANATGDILLTAVTPSGADTITLFLDLRKDSRDYDSGQTADPVAFNLGPARFS